MSSVDISPCTGITIIHTVSHPNLVPFLSKSHCQFISSSYWYLCWLRSVHHFLCTYHYRRQTVECTHMQVGLLSKENVNLSVQVNLQFGSIGCSSTQAGAVFEMT